MRLSQQFCVLHVHVFTSGLTPGRLSDQIILIPQYLEWIVKRVVGTADDKQQWPVKISKTRWSASIFNVIGMAGTAVMGASCLSTSPLHSENEPIAENHDENGHNLTTRGGKVVVREGIVMMEERDANIRVDVRRVSAI